MSPRRSSRPGSTCPLWNSYLMCNRLSDSFSSNKIGLSWFFECGWDSHVQCPLTFHSQRSSSGCQARSDGSRGLGREGSSAPNPDNSLSSTWSPRTPRIVSRPIKIKVKPDSYSGSEIFELAVDHKLHQVIFEGKQFTRIRHSLLLVQILHGFPMLSLLLIEFICNFLQ